MKITPKFTENDIRNFILKKIEVIQDVVKDQLVDVAEQFVADARTVNTYKDRTSNLRGSIGYAIVKDGVEIFGNFDGVAEGQAKSKQLVNEVQADYPKGFALIVVAGMNYAVYVEAKGFDVLTGSSQTAESNLKRQFDRLSRQLKKVK